MDKCILKLLQKGGKKRRRLLLAIRACSLIAVIRTYIRRKRGKGCTDGAPKEKAVLLRLVWEGGGRDGLSGP